MYNKSEQHYINLEKARTAAAVKDKECQYCGKITNTSNIKRHSNSCYLNPKNKKLCIICEEPIKTFKSSVTCGYSCSNKHFRTGKNNGNWKPDAYRSTCFEHHEKKCVVCAEELIIAVHHLDEDHSNNSPENLIPMCPTHHQYWHSNYQYLIKDKVDEYIKDWKSKRLNE